MDSLGPGIQRFQQEFNSESGTPEAEKTTLYSNRNSGAGAWGPIIHPRPSAPFVTVILNGKMAINAVLGGVTSERMFPIQINGSNNGVLVHTTASCPCRVGADKVYKIEVTFRARSEDGEAAAGGEASLLLGFITRDASHVSGAVSLPFIPQIVDVYAFEAPEALDTNELKFTADVVGIFRSQTLNPGAGSLPSALTQNYSKHLPQYKAVVVDKYQSSWHQYLKANADTFWVFQLSEDEIEAHRLAPHVKPHEVRVAIRQAARGGLDDGGAAMATILAADREIASSSAQHERKLIEYLKSILDGVPEGMDQRVVMDHLERNEDFLHFISPSYSTLYRFLVQQRDTFAWTNHDLLPMCVGLSRGVRKGEIRNDAPANGNARGRPASDVK
ncbi:hypothetical protein DIPPA_07770 [Diplonema papillatum]|nr:hypothetical protein DIPPA_07770 [Diplonema papillatum]